MSQQLSLGNVELDVFSPNSVDTFFLNMVLQNYNIPTDSRIPLMLVTECIRVSALSDSDSILRLSCNST